MALAHKPGFFPAQFNLAVAYLLLKDHANARDALERARVLAPDAAARARIDEMLAQVGESTVPAGHPSGARWQPATAETLLQ
jgi:hypothetical protein